VARKKMPKQFFLSHNEVGIFLVARLQDLFKTSVCGCNHEIFLMVTDVFLLWLQLPVKTVLVVVCGCNHEIFIGGYTRKIWWLQFFTELY